MIAIVQAGSIIYDTPATLDKLEKLVAEAADKGARLILFPEAFIGGYPKGLNFGIVLGSRAADGREEFNKYFNSAIEEDGNESKRMKKIAQIHNVNLIVGVVERQGRTLYCSVFFYSSSGYLGKHRKLMPTALERCVWGCGDGSTMPVRFISYLGSSNIEKNSFKIFKGIELYLAPTVDDRDVWLSTMRTIAVEGRCFVISACQFLKASDYPKGHYMREKTTDDKILIRGGSCAVDPLGTVLIEPDYSGELIQYLSIDLSQITRAKMDLDSVGHYSRPEVFQLVINETPFKAVTRK
uniref:CN hydrolase domain-containing protein n=1 Tax=Heterorhabditis bacteriophora TaxID=37862 RepID=A0A1I7X7E9_HETBA